MAEEPSKTEDDKEAERRFNETLGRMLGTPHKPHKEEGREPKPAPDVVNSPNRPR